MSEKNERSSEKDANGLPTDGTPVGTGSVADGNPGQEPLESNPARTDGAKDEEVVDGGAEKLAPAEDSKGVKKDQNQDNGQRGRNLTDPQRDKNHFQRDTNR